MSLYFNFWVPDDRWEDAYDAGLQPVNDANQNQIFKYEIDYVQVSVPEPSTIGLFAVAVLVMGNLLIIRRWHK